MKKAKQPQKQQLFLRHGLFFGMGILAGISLLVTSARLAWHSTYYPGVEVGGVAIGGLTREAAKVRVDAHIADYTLKLGHGEQTWQVPRETLNLESEAALSEAYRYGRRLQIQDYLGLILGKRAAYPLAISPSQTQVFQDWVSAIAMEVEIPPVAPNISVTGKKIMITNGVDGRLIDRELLLSQVAQRASFLESRVIEVPTKTVRQHLSDTELATLQTRGERLLNATLILSFEDERIRLQTKELLTFLSTEPGAQVVEQSAVITYVQGLSKNLNREAQDAKFSFTEGQVKEFAPGKDGVTIDEEQTAKHITAGVEKLLTSEAKSASVEIVARRTPPKITTDRVNDLGIKERIGRGESYYAHSIANRIYNVGLASARTQSALIAPGEEYSFNREVGEIAGETGYKTAYVISGGRTVLGDGGGVCQVSTTIFRAALNAGLPITERWAHAYRVGYYEQNSKPGIDATVYSPSKDLRFKNDTPGHILIQTINDPKRLHLVVEIYGTSDGRVASVSEPKVWGIAPPPPDLYQDDPSLPSGVVKQVDWAAWGAKASFTYTVRRNGEIIQEKTFTSSYKPWQNVYLRGTAQ